MTKAVHFLTIMHSHSADYASSEHYGDCFNIKVTLGLGPCTNVKLLTLFSVMLNCAKKPSGAPSRRKRSGATGTSVLFEQLSARHQFLSLFHSWMHGSCALQMKYS